jgi:predicted dehydrogenase
MEAPLSARVVVRGAGSIGARHADVFCGLGDDVLTWPVRDRANPDRGYPDIGHLDDRSGPGALASADLVVVATDTSRHVSDAIEALDAGADRVLVEKPVSTSEERASALAAHPRSDRVWVAAPLRAHQAFRYLHALVSAADIWSSAHLWAQSWLPDWRSDRDFRQSYSARPEEGGVLRDLVHEIDYATVLLGPPDLVAACLEHRGPLPIDAEQTATLLWRATTTTVTCRLDYVTRPASRGIVVTGRDGSIAWNVTGGTVLLSSADGNGDSRTFAEDLDRDRVMATQARAMLTLSPTDDAARRVDAGAPATLSDGLAAVRLCDRARELSVPEDPEATQETTT